MACEYNCFCNCDGSCRILSFDEILEVRNVCFSIHSRQEDDMKKNKKPYVFVEFDKDDDNDSY